MPYETAYHKEDSADPYWVINSDTNQPVGKHPTAKLQRDHLRALYANVPDAKEVTMPTTKAAYDWDQCIKDQLEEYGDEETAKKVCGAIRARQAGKEISAKERADIEAELGIERKPSIVDRVLSFLRGEKEGRRNSNTDAGRLQQIHDLAVENGAACPMVLKQANGSYRWILLSTNSYQDRDGEIVSQKAQEEDVERMNQTGNFGPLRLWHLGYPDVAQKEAGPGIDVGVCDYSQMFGRIRVESGTFTDNRIGAAIKQRSDQWGGSIGFFHPLDQPDREGVYHDSATFERSLLPRVYASNPLTPLAAIMKENDNMKQEEKVKQLSDLLGDAALADQVLKQAEATEKAAQERGLKYKATDTPPTTEDQTTEMTPTDKPKKDEPAKAETKQMTPEECITACQECIAACQKCVEACQGMVESMGGSMKERTDKEASITAQIAAVDAALKETRQIVDVLNADVPKGVKRHLASEAKETIAPDGKYKNLEAPAPDPLGTIFNWLAQPAQGMPPVVQSTPDK